MPLSEESESTSRSTGSNAVVDDAQDLIAGEGSDKDGKAQITLTNVQTSKTKSQTDDNGDDKREEYGNESYGIQDHPDTDAASLNPPSITNQVRVTPTPYDNYIANGDNANAPNQNESAETQYDSPSNEAHKSNGKGKSAGAASSATGATTGATKTIPGKSESTGKADKSNGKGKSAGSVASAGDVTDIYGGKEEATAPTELRGRSKRSSGGGGGEGDEKISTVSSGKGSSSSSTSKKQTSNTNPPSHSNEGKPGDKLTKLEAMSIATMDAATQDAKQYISMGLCLGVLNDSAMALILLIGLHVLFFVAMFILKPFPDSSSRAKYATYALTVLKVANFALAFAPAFINILAIASAKLEVDNRIARDTETGIGAPPLIALSELVLTKPREFQH
ncbi:hypothetical protein PF001_g6535 [Phytophthora fragariae]|uniref:Transmembrane protein n=1 Tax=Phytophthora fragariae TaxID=53985 RepID=A0A6A4E698_9STRA|nr:hypothetical protein PF001_g6535 [Phytophthora fragariae]